MAAVSRRRQCPVPGCGLASVARRALLGCGLRARCKRALLRRRRPTDRRRHSRYADPFPRGRARLEPLAQRSRRYLCTGAARRLRGGGRLPGRIRPLAPGHVLHQPPDLGRPSGRAHAGARLLLSSVLRSDESKESLPLHRGRACPSGRAVISKVCHPKNGHSPLTPSVARSTRRDRPQAERRRKNERIVARYSCAPCRGSGSPCSGDGRCWRRSSSPRGGERHGSSAPSKAASCPRFGAGCSIRAIPNASEASPSSRRVDSAR